MNDQISRQRLIEELEESSMINVYDPYKGEFADYIKLDTARELIQSQPPASQWIPCSDTRKPADGQTVVVTVDLFGKWTHIDTATYHAEIPKGWWEHDWEGEGFYQSHECGWCRREDVVAWFYPEPYKGWSDDL